jgi:hypothetical protein
MTQITKLIHPLETKRALDEVTERKLTHGGKTRVLCLLLGCLAEESISEREQK